MNVKLDNIKFDCLEFSEVVEFLKHYDYSQTGYICFSDFYSFNFINKKAELHGVMNDSLLTLVDGKLVQILLRIYKKKQNSIISAYLLSKELFKTNLKHYFLGPDDETNKKLINNILKEFPDAEISGASSLPLLQLNDIKNNDVIKSLICKINSLKPDLIWIGISSPKQDILMHEYHFMLERGIMLGAGGVLDYLAGNIHPGPEWIKRFGFRWLYRFVQNPKRFFGKNISNFSGLFNTGISHFKRAR